MRLPIEILCPHVPASSLVTVKISIEFQKTVGPWKHATEVGSDGPWYKWKSRVQASRDRLQLWSRGHREECVAHARVDPRAVL
jgi:hypothetical protein